MLYCGNRIERRANFAFLQLIEGEQMRNRIFGLIGVVWGGAVLISSLVKGGVQGSGAYAAGQSGAMVFASLMLLVGMYYLVKGDGTGPKG